VRVKPVPQSPIQKEPGAMHRHGSMLE